MTNVFEDLMRTNDPARGFPAYTPDDRDRFINSVITAPASVTSRLDEPDQSVIPDRPTRPSRPWARWVTVAAAAILALALVLVPGLGLFRGGATAEAVGLLDEAIIAATDPPTRADQYWKITTNSITSDIIGEGIWGDDTTISALRHAQRIAFVAVDGSRPPWYVDRTGPYVKQVSGPATKLPATGWKTTETWTTNLSERDSNYIDILGLPTNPFSLRTELYRIGHGRGASDDEEAISLISEILQRGYATAALRKALFETMKTVPGVAVVDRNVTLDGRTGVALGRPEPARGGERHELIFDPDTGEFIGERQAWTTPKATLEDAISRELVDKVDPDVIQAAHHYQCQVQAGGAVVCPSR
jgi:hypothetical protein